MSGRISDERLALFQRFYASHARRIPLDDGSEKPCCGEFYAAHEVDKFVAELRALAERMRPTDTYVLPGYDEGCRYASLYWLSELDSILAAHDTQQAEGKGE